MICRKTYFNEQRIHQYIELPQIIFPINAKNLFDEVILVDTNRRIKVPDLDYGEFLWFIGIWLFMTANPDTNCAEYFSKNPIDVFSGCSIRVNQFMYGNHFESIWSALRFTPTPSYFWYKLYESRQKIVTWNGHVQKVFVPYWISCSYEYFYKISKNIG